MAVLCLINPRKIINLMTVKKNPKNFFNGAKKGSACLFLGGAKPIINNRHFSDFDTYDIVLHQRTRN